MLFTYHCPMENIIGYLAAFCTTAAFIPQVLLVIKTKDTRGISLGMYIVFCIGLSLWLIYGIFKNDTAIILANVITLALASIVLGYKVRERLKTRTT